MYERDLASALANVAGRRGRRGFTFEDLAAVGHRYRATVGVIADWLARARSTGLVEEVGFDRGIGGPQALGPRRYRLSNRVPERTTAAMSEELAR